MSPKRILIIATTIIVSVAGFFLFADGEKRAVVAGGAEIYQVGVETVILGGVGSTMVGDYPDPVPEGPGVREIVLSYTCVTEKVLFEAILPAFNAYWEAKTGEKVRFTTGYNMIGIDSVATTVYDKPAHILVLTSNTDGISRGFNTTKWQKTKRRSVVCSYPNVLLVRKGNPKNITSYTDLVRPEVVVIHGDALGTHGGISHLFTLYGAALKDSETRKGKKDFAEADKIFNKIEEKSITRFSGKQALALLDQGIGDVAITNESYAINLVKKNPSYEIIVPPHTMTTELVAYTLKKNISKEDTELVNEFVDFLFAEQSQEAFASAGFRPSDPAVLARHTEFLSMPDIFTMDYVGEPGKMKKELILEKWVAVKNKNKPDKEKVKIKKLGKDQLPDEPGLPMQQMLPE